MANAQKNLTINARANEMFEELSSLPNTNDPRLEFIINAVVEALDALTEYTYEDSDADAQNSAIVRINCLAETVKNTPLLN